MYTLKQICRFLVMTMLPIAIIAGCGNRQGIVYPEVVTIPEVNSTSPADLAVAVAFDAVISATFSEEMKASTITTANFTLMQGKSFVSGTVSYNGLVGTFVPATDLTPNTLYTATLTTGVQNLAGEGLSSNYVWTFTTDTAAAAAVPVVTSTNPANTDTGVVLNKVIGATFSKVMDASTFTLENGITPVSGLISYSGTTAMFTPSSALAPNTVYTATVTTGVRDFVGNAMTGNYVWRFTTGSEAVVDLPAVLATSPEEGDTAVSLNQKISATFNRTMDAATLTSATFTLKNGATSVIGFVSYVGTTAMFSPLSNLAPNTVYTGTITHAVKDISGNALGTDYMWTFTTGSAVVITSPTVRSTSPINGDTGVILNQQISAVFSKTMDASTFTSASFTLKRGTAFVAGFVYYSGATAVFAPSSNLAPNTVYTATLTTANKDLAGNSMAGNYSWSFTTSAATVIAAPMVSSTDPANTDTGIALNQKIAAVFSKTMDATTLTSATFTLKRGLTSIAGFVSYSGTTAIFAPAANLLSNTLYTATVTVGVKDLVGNPLAQSYVWSFRTGTSAAIVAPIVISTSPGDSDTGIALNNKVAATFSKTMDASTFTSATFTLKHGAVTVPGFVSYSGTTAQFSPSVDLLPGTVYTARVTTSVSDLAGNALAANYGWVFTTGAASVDTAPTVSSTDPADGDTGVALNKHISTLFSKVMDGSTITTATFTLMEGTSFVAGTVSHIGNTATYIPSGDLLPNTEYTATITTGAQDLAGNALLNNYVWSFTTETPALVVDLGAAAAFGGFGGSAGLTSQGIFTVINGDIGTTAASTLVTGFHDEIGDVYTETPLNVGTVNGSINCAPPAPGTASKFSIAQQGLADATTAFNFLAGLPGGSDAGAGELGGLVLAPATYTAAAGTFKITSGDLTLDAQNNPNAVWVFQMAQSLTVGQAGQARSIILVNGAQAKNIYWQVGSAATINGAGGGTMAGTIISYSGVTFSTAGNVVLTTLNGRALSLNASVTMVNTVINIP